ncbi:MAG: 2-nitropropane dioxygenase [Gammaproteobacteria bacterium BRH_c0]|nr:MAG: 2-nitropropane dioxygenase [Gammaproteobacteria bacterium BRH_c0]
MVKALEDLLSIELPIIQAPMAGVQGSALAIAVSSAGGLGSLPCAMLDNDSIRQEIMAIQLHTSKPFNVNFFCHRPPKPDAEKEARWRELLAPFYRELAVEPPPIGSGTGRLPLSGQAVEVLDDMKPAVVSFHFGLPAPELLARVKSTGAKILASATTVAEALWLEARGVDAIIAQGTEAGGHRGSFLSDDLSLQMGTFALVPQVVARVNVPVIAAGGIASADGVAAAMKLGAVGVQVGTTYLLCPEAFTSVIHRASLKSAQAQHTAITNLFTGRPARGIVNRLIRELGPINSAAPPFPLAASVLAPLRGKAESLASGDFSPLWAGQNTAGCKEISAAELTRQLAEQLR